MRQHLAVQEYLEDARRRSSVPCPDVVEAPDPSAVVADALHELWRSLEEPAIAEEELRMQADELAETRGEAEWERLRHGFGPEERGRLRVLTVEGAEAVTTDREETVVLTGAARKRLPTLAPRSLSLPPRLSALAIRRLGHAVARLNRDAAWAPVRSP